MTTRKIDQIGKQYAEIDAKIKALQDEQKALRLELVRHHIKYGTPVQSVKISDMLGAKSLDKSMLELALSEIGKTLSEFEKRGKPYQKITVTK